jgi:acetylglutamate kinase
MLLLDSPPAGVAGADQLNSLFTASEFTAKDPLDVDALARKADVLIEAMSWIRRFRGQLMVLKLGGSALEDPAIVRSLLIDITFLETVGIRPVVIHGGGKAINAAMARSGLQPRWVKGRRYTDQQTLDIVSDVLAYEICKGLVDQINLAGGKAAAVSYLTRNVLQAEPLVLNDDHGSGLDLGFVGRVVAVDADYLIDLTKRGIIPILPSIGVDSAGQRYNVNADTAAAAVARSLGVEKMVFLSDVPGIYLDRTRPETLVSQLSAERCRELIADGTIAGGMVPKIEAALDALNAGARKVHIIDGRLPHSILLEIFSDRGIGTEIVA